MRRVRHGCAAGAASARPARGGRSVLRRVRHGLAALVLLLLTGCGQLVATIPMQGVRGAGVTEIALPAGVEVRFPIRLANYSGTDVVLLHAELRREGETVAAVDCEGASVDGSAATLWQSNSDCALVVPDGGADQVVAAIQPASSSSGITAEGVEVQVRVPEDAGVTPRSDVPDRSLPKLLVAGLVAAGAGVVVVHLGLVIWLLRKRRKFTRPLARVEALPGEPWELRFDPKKTGEMAIFMRFKMRGRPRPGLICSVQVELHGNVIIDELVGLRGGARAEGVTLVPTTTWFSVSSKTSESGFVELVELGLVRPGYEAVARGTVRPIEGTEISRLEILVADA